jgi:hypothetical protein
MALNKAQRRYNRAVLITMAGYMFTLFGVMIYADRTPLRGVGGAAIGILPALPVIAVFWIMWRYLNEERDEYLRHRATRQALIASGFMLSIATAWGFLENFDIVPHAPAYYAAVLWFFGLGVGSCVNVLTRSRGEEA